MKEGVLIDERKEEKKVKGGDSSILKECLFKVHFFFFSSSPFLLFLQVLCTHGIKFIYI
jgi:hypothetical protein